jgi:disulfide bond formation protein DsbB
MAALARTLNALALLGVCTVMLGAFYWQLARGELPCPLCLLQRAAFLAAGLGLLLNVRFGAAEAHYGIVIVSALAGAAFAVRQILRYIVPGTGAYGSAVLGFHFYTWALVGFVVLIAFAGLMLFLEAQFVEGVRDLRPAAGAQALGWLFVLVVLAHAASALLQCGFGPCPENPTGYDLLAK